MDLMLSPEAATRISRLTGEVNERIAARMLAIVVPFTDDRAADRLATDRLIRDDLDAQIEDWRNLAVTLVALIGLRGRVILENDRNFLGRNEWITYGVNQDRDGRWSVNS